VFNHSFIYSAAQIFLYLRLTIRACRLNLLAAIAAKINCRGIAITTITIALSSIAATAYKGASAAPRFLVIIPRVSTTFSSRFNPKLKK
jgi:hypothetical protein